MRCPGRLFWMDDVKFRDGCDLILSKKTARSETPMIIPNCDQQQIILQNVQSEGREETAGKEDGGTSVDPYYPRAC